MKVGPKAPSNPVKLLFPKQTVKDYVIPVKPHGHGHFIVEAMINGNIKANLLVDTGASRVSLSGRIGDLLRVTNNKDIPTQITSTANGEIEVSLIILDSLKIGEVEEFVLEAHINPHYKDKEIDGLLGMSFLGNFKVEIDQKNNKMFLKPLAVRGETVWGGHNEAWWKNRYKTIVQEMNHYYGYISNAFMTPKTRYDVTRKWHHYAKLYKALEKRADQVDLPQKFRVHP